FHRFDLPDLLLFLLRPSTPLYTLSLHDALPIYHWSAVVRTRVPARFRWPTTACCFWMNCRSGTGMRWKCCASHWNRAASPSPAPDRKSTRLNSSHVKISYAVFCLKKQILTFPPL